MKGLETPAKRNAFAAWLCQCIEASEKQKGDLPTRWRRLEAMASQLPTAGGTETDPTPGTYPFVSAKTDQLVGMICGPVLATLPYFVAKAYGPQKAKAKISETAVQFALQNAQFDRRFRKGVRTAAKAEPALYKLVFDEGEKRGSVVGPSIKVIHPRNAVIYPLYLGGVIEARVVGERYMARAKDVQRKGKTGEYYPEAEKVVGGDIDPKEDDRFNIGLAEAQPFAAITDADDMAVECFEVIARYDLDGDGEEEMNLYRVAFKQGILLEAQPFGALLVDEMPLPGDAGERLARYSRPWYFEAMLHEQEDEEFYRRVPFAQKLQALQLILDRLVNAMIEGAEFRACPVGFTSGALSDKFVKMVKGTVYNIPGMDPSGIHWMDIPVDLQHYPGLIDLILSFGDSAAHISQAGEGKSVAGNQTATEIEAIQAGQNVGRDEYRDVATQGPAEMCDFVRELLYIHHGAMVAAYGEAYPVQNPEDIKDPVTFEPNGRSAANTPGAQVEKLRLGMEVILPMLTNLGLPMPIALQVAMKLGRATLQSLDLNVDVEDVIPQEWVDELEQQTNPQPGGLPGGNPADAGGGLDQIQSVIAGLGGGNSAASLPPEPANAGY